MKPAVGFHQPAPAARCRRRFGTSTLAVSSLCSFVFCVFGACTPNLRADDSAGFEFFEKKIRPVFIEHCQQCHGDTKQKGGLQIHSRERLLKGGDSGPAIAPGDPNKSRLIAAVRYDDDLLRMPPKSKLPDAVIADLTAWVKIGAPWPAAKVDVKSVGQTSVDFAERRKHWAWQPIRTASPPAVRDASWLRSPIDAFILARLETGGLTPAAPAERSAWLRRITYDLIGLPPTVAEIRAFLADTSPAAFEMVIDRLLASPRYGERWGRHWLDLVRFADTYGHEFDVDIPHAHVYRDYVIRAFNADVPYGRLVTEHIAGDLLGEPRRHPTESFNESVIGTGFWFLGEAKHSPVDVRIEEADRIDNQIDVMSKAFLGLTVSCARCHDHKFDAITAKDYYALVGYLQSSRMQHALIDAPEPLHRAAKSVAADRAACAALARNLIAPRLLAELPGRIERLLADAKREPGHLLNICTPRGDAAVDAERLAAVRRDAVNQFRHDAALAQQYAQQATRLADFGRKGFKDWFAGGAAFGDGPSKPAETLIRLVGPTVQLKVLPAGVAHSSRVSNKLHGVLRTRTFVLQKKQIWFHVAGANAHINVIIDGFQHIRDPIYGGLRLPIVHGDKLEWRPINVGMWLGHKAYVEIVDDGSGFVAVDDIICADDGPPRSTGNSLIVQLLADQHIDSESELRRRLHDSFREIVEQWRTGRLGKTADCSDRVALVNLLLQGEFAVPELTKAAALIDEKETRIIAPRKALAMAEGTPWNERVHIRGNPHNPGEVVPRRFLEAIPGSVNRPVPSDCGRLDLAKQVASPSNPLLARVMVNRIWQHHFGAGIVGSPDNFGAIGERPTHPELLDYLAHEFVRSGWSIKLMHRLLLRSNTYRMTSRAADVNAERHDPQNRWLHRMNVRRLEAECVRDAILAVSGRLDQRMYGPGIAPYLTAHMQGRGRPAQSGPLDGAGRRSVYLSVRRNFLTPLFLAFDYPIPFTTIGRRSASNVPAQALTLMNNPLVIEQAEHWSRHATSGAMAQRVTEMYWTAFSRPPTAHELAQALAFLDEQRTHYGGRDSDRAWRDLCHVLFNVKEFIFIN